LKGCESNFSHGILAFLLLAATKKEVQRKLIAQINSAAHGKNTAV